MEVHAFKNLFFEVSNQNSLIHAHVLSKAHSSPIIAQLQRNTESNPACNITPLVSLVHVIIS